MSDKELPHASDLEFKEKHSASYHAFVDRVISEANRGNREFNFYPVEGDDFLEFEMKEIQAKGYELYWSRPCLWYEVKIVGVRGY